MTPPGRILGLRDRFGHDAGAYTPYGIVIPLITSTQLPGPYRIRHYQVEFDVRYSNKVMTTPYRGAGRPHGAFVMERVIGLIARQLGLEPAEVRRRNLIQPDEFPWDVGLTFQDGGPTRYDSGNYPAGLEMALDAIGARTFRAEQAAARAEGRYLGLGIACYVEGTGIGPYEGAHVRVEPSGRVLVATGLTTQGQGHQTTFAQLAAEALGCSPADVTVVTGDTGRFNWGAGTFASRALVTSGNAVAVAARKVRDKALRVAADLLEAAPGDIELIDGAARVKGVPGRQLTLGALATVANPIRYAYGKEAAEAALRLVKPRQGAVLRDDEEPGLEARGYYAPPQATFASGCHAAVVEVDVETGEVAFRKYVVQHDCGIIVNPTVVEGQIHGGVAQGIGGALYEKLAYDEHGQLLAGSFMDFLMPTAAEIPDITVVHLETPSPLNPLGVKGVGEAGAIPVPALVAEAVDDALAPFGVRVREMPLSPTRIRELVEQAGLRRRSCVGRGVDAGAEARFSDRVAFEQPVTRSLRAIRVSRCVRDRLDGGGRGVVLGIQRRACWLAVGDGSLVILSTPDVPLAPNGLAVDVADRDTLAGAGLRAGQVVALVASAPPDSAPTGSWRSTRRRPGSRARASTGLSRATSSTGCGRRAPRWSRMGPGSRSSRSSGPPGPTPARGGPVSSRRRDPGASPVRRRGPGRCGLRGAGGSRSGRARPRAHPVGGRSSRGLRRGLDAGRRFPRPRRRRTRARDGRHRRGSPARRLAARARLARACASGRASRADDPVRRCSPGR